MNLSADALLFLASKGMSVADIAEFVRLTEQRKDPTAAERMARHRAKRKAAAVTRNVTANPPIEDHTPNSVISSNDEKQNTPRKQRGGACVRPDDVSEPLFDAWVKHRGKHRSDIGPTTIAAMRKEAADVGWSLEDAMTEQISRGWRGFKAKWVKDDDRVSKTFGGDHGTGTGQRDNRDGIAKAIDRRLAELEQPPGPLGRFDDGAASGLRLIAGAGTTV